MMNEVEEAIDKMASSSCISPSVNGLTSADSVSEEEHSLEIKPVKAEMTDTPSCTTSLSVSLPIDTLNTLVTSDNGQSVDTITTLVTTDDGQSIEKQQGVKRKRNLPGTPDPDAEVVALSPRTLMATHKFTCEVCGRGFQREQNLQLHKRGHNLPGSLKPRANKDKEVRKKVYVCPEPTCVHHDPSRALGDLTGIKKHFCRKHGEKKWNCDKCSKKYAVLSDWKAHSKTCGTRDYKCECGSVFYRRDSFVTHKAFCDELTVESARLAGAPEPPAPTLLLEAPPSVLVEPPPLMLSEPPPSVLLDAPSLPEPPAPRLLEHPPAPLLLEHRPAPLFLEPPAPLLLDPPPPTHLEAPGSILLLEEIPQEEKDETVSYRQLLGEDYIDDNEELST